MGGEHFLLTAVGAAIVHCLADFQHGGGLHDFLDAGGIIDAGKLDQYLVIAKAVFLNHRLGDAKLVDTVADGFDRLLDGARLERQQHVRLEGDGPGISGARDQVVFAETGPEMTERRSPAEPDINPAQGDALRIIAAGSSLRMSPIGDVLFLQRILEPLDGLIGFGVDGVVDLDLKDQVGPAAKVKAEMDVLLNDRR